MSDVRNKRKPDSEMVIISRVLKTLDRCPDGTKIRVVNYVVDRILKEEQDRKDRLIASFTNVPATPVSVETPVTT